MENRFVIKSQDGHNISQYTVLCIMEENRRADETGLANTVHMVHDDFRKVV